MQHMPDTVLPMEITPQELAQRARAGEKLFFIDVREPSEYQQSRIEDAELIPMGTIPANLQHIEQLSDERTIIVFCHHGVRSLHVVNWLRNQGVMACQSMAGGIDRWSCEIDPGIPRYYS
jgi:rhodanese-related sulfurtransferase